jgi:hypothetical protein
MAKKKRKTKQQKIITQLKRELVLAKKDKVLGGEKKHKSGEKLARTSEGKEVTSLVLGKENLSLKDEKGTITGQNDHSQIYTYDLGLIRKDLTKTLALTMLALSVEILIFFLVEKEGIKLFHF